jgi:hypothetical protein
MYPARPLLLLCLLIALPVSAQALRCGTRLVQEGDLALQVRDKCGDPISEELIGYTLRGGHHLGGARDREFKIEQWIYGPSKGYYDVLTFEAGRLRKLERIRE